MHQDHFTKEEIVSVGMKIKNAKRIAVISPKNLDGDSLGSTCALNIVLKNLGKQSQLICLADIPDNMRFIPTANEFIQDLDTSTYDLFLITDCGEAKLTGFDKTHPEMFDGTKEFINIDHHISNTKFGTINIVKHQTAAACIVVYRLLKHWNVRITPDIATALMVGIYTDTGSFMHSNTSEEVYQVAGELLSCGASIPKIMKNIFKNTPLSTMKLWGRVMDRARQNDRKITVSYVLQKDFDELGAKPDELSGVVDYINAVPDSYFSVLLTEFEGKIKGSLRTLRDDVNLSDIAKVFGGGGHAKASGFTMPGRLAIDERIRIEGAVAA